MIKDDDGRDEEMLSLNLSDLDVQALEERLELAALGADCWNQQCGVNAG